MPTGQKDIMTSRVLHICHKEGLNLESDALLTLSSISKVDLCWAITFLQGGARLLKVVVEANNVTDEQKSRICSKLGKEGKCIADGATSGF